MAMKIMITFRTYKTQVMAFTETFGTTVWKMVMALWTAMMMAFIFGRTQFQHPFFI
jgi:hypothetical protein